MTPTEWADLSCRLAWSLAGFLLGYLLGRAGREIHEVKEAVVTDTQCPTESRRRPGVFGFVQTQWFGAILIILAVATVSVSGYTLNKQGRLLDCQTAYNIAYADALKERTMAAGTDRQATRDMVGTIAGIEAVPAEQRRGVYQSALTKFLTTTANADAQRNRNPLPSARCS